MDQSALTLFRLLEMTKSALKTAFRENYWVLAEISEMKVNYSGHCYLELIEKEEDGDSVRAKARATIWAATFRMLKPYFETATNIQFAAGIKVLVKVSVDFHEVYGFSLNINDIEPSYTIGDAARRRQEIINRLKAEGVYEMNKALEMPVLPKRIAIISSNTAAGYGDFMNQMFQNPYGYTFSIKLFPAVMQGDAAEQSVVTALERVFEYEQYFDIVVIIRGGGSQSDLACFNSYWMAYNICQFPIPVFTGIGHEQDETIADLVAHTRLKTPTAVAEYIISLFRDADETLNELAAILDDGVRGRLETEKGNLERHILLLKPLVREMLTRNNTLVKNLTMDTARHSRKLISGHKIDLNTHAGMLRTHATRSLLGNKHYRDNLAQHLALACKTRLDRDKHRLEIYSGKNDGYDPFRILERGYSVTYFNGRAVKNENDIPAGTVIQTRLSKGRLKSKTI